MTLMVKDLSLTGAKLYELMEHEPQDATRFTRATSLSSAYSPSTATTSMDHKQFLQLLQEFKLLVV